MQEFEKLMQNKELKQSFTIKLNFAAMHSDWWEFQGRSCFASRFLSN